MTTEAMLTALHDGNTPSGPDMLPNGRFDARITESHTATSSFMASIREMHNNSMPFSKLSDDVISIILDMVTTMDTRQPYWILRTSLMCRRWRRIILNNATYWTQVKVDVDSPNFHDQLRFAELCLERSRQAALSFTMKQGWTSSDGSLPIPSPVVSSAVPLLLLSNISRIRILRLRLSPHSLRLFTRLSANFHAPRLETLSLSTRCPVQIYYEDGDSVYHEQRYIEELIASRASLNCLEDVPMFSDVFPSLRNLQLLGFYAPWYSSMYRGLVSLSITTTPAVHLWTDFVHAFQGSPRLESLNILFTSRITANRLPALSIDLPVVSLLHLSYLGLHNFTCFDVRQFFRHILVSAGATLYIDIAVPVYPGLSHGRLKDILDTLPTFLRARLDTVHGLRIANVSEDRRLEFDVTTPENGQFSLSLSVWDHNHMQSLKYTFQSVFDIFTGVTGLTLEGEFQDLLKNQPNPYFSRPITKLTLSQSANADVLEELSKVGHLGHVNILRLHQIIDWPPIHTVHLLLAQSTLESLIMVGHFDAHGTQVCNAARDHGIEVRFENSLDDSGMREQVD